MTSPSSTYGAQGLRRGHPAGDGITCARPRCQQFALTPLGCALSRSDTDRDMPTRLAVRAEPMPRSIPRLDKDGLVREC